MKYLTGALLVLTMFLIISVCENGTIGVGPENNRC